MVHDAEAKSVVHVWSGGLLTHAPHVDSDSPALLIKKSVSQHSKGTRSSPLSASSQQQQLNIGWQLLHEGSFEDAYGAFAEAAKDGPPHVKVLLGLGMALGELGRQEEALAAFHRVLLLDDRQSLAHEALGDLLAERGDLNGAIVHYQRGTELDRQNIALQDRLRTIQQELVEDQKWDRLSSNHFLVKYRAVFTKAHHLQKIVGELEAVYQEIGRIFLFYPRKMISVRVYPGDEFWGTTKSPPWAQGLYDGSIHVPLQIIESDPKVLKGLLRHEYTHALVDLLSMGRTPVWLTEGLAGHFEQPVDREHMTDGSQQLPQSVISRQQFDQFFVELSPHAAREAYGVSLQATHHLLQTYGMERMTLLLKGLAKQANFSRVFEATFQLPYTTFQHKWFHEPKGQLQ